MAAPTVRVEVLFDTTGEYFGRFWTIGESEIGGPDPIGGNSWVDLASQIYEGHVERGKQRELDEVSPGRLVVTIDNANQYFDPDYTASPYYGQIQPGRGVRVIATVGGVDYRLFTGTADDWQLSDDAGVHPTVTLVAYDALSDLGAQELDPVSPAAYSGDLSSARVARVLNLPEVDFPADRRSIDTGLSTFGATTFTERNSAASYLQLCAQSEGGTLYATVEDVLRFAARDSGPGAVAATFSNEGTAGMVLYGSASRPFSRDLLHTRVVTAGTSGNEQAVTDATAIDGYKIRTVRRTDQLVLSDTEMASQARWLLSRHASPERRFRDITVDVALQPVARQAELLGLDLTARVTVRKALPDASVVVQDALVDGLEWHFGGLRFDAKVTVAAGEQLFGWIIGDDTYGLIGTARINY